MLNKHIFLQQNKTHAIILYLSPLQWTDSSKHAGRLISNSLHRFRCFYANVRHTVPKQEVGTRAAFSRNYLRHAARLTSSN